MNAVSFPGDIADAEALKRLLWRLGAGMALCYGLLVPVSYAIAPFSPLEKRHPGEVVLFQRMLDAIPMPSSWQLSALQWTEGAGLLTNRSLRAVLHLIPFIAAMVIFGLVVRLLFRHRNLIDASTTDLLFRLAVALALIKVLAWPDFTWDFWLSIGWGRMIAEGVNPYYQGLTGQAMTGLPFGPDGDRMTYGPVWAWLSAAIAAVSGESIITAFVLGKGLLLTAWIGILEIIRRIAREHGGPALTGIAVCLFGWMPTSTRYSISEGHNDIVMVAALMLWLYLVSRRRHLLSPIALTVSVLIKYITLPMVLIEVAAARGRVRFWRYAGVLGFCLAGGILLFLPFFRGPDMFTEASRMRRWIFWTPADAVRDSLVHLGVRVGYLPLNLVVMVILLGVTAWVIRNYLRRPVFLDLVTIVLMYFGVLLFTVVGHVWPWFVIWLLPAAALTWETRIGQAALAFCFLVPILDQGAYLSNTWSGVRPALGVLLYAGTAVLFLVVARFMPDKSRLRAGQPSTPTPITTTTGTP